MILEVEVINHRDGTATVRVLALPSRGLVSDCHIPATRVGDFLKMTVEARQMVEHS